MGIKINLDIKINEFNYWSTLIEKSKRILTIPYIIGAKEIMLQNCEKDSIVDLINKIINSESKKVYNIYYCDTIGNYVIKEDYIGYHMKGLEIKNPKTNNVSLILTYSTDILGKTIDEIVNRLSMKYEKEIATNKFSFDNFQFREFNKTEIEKIKTIANTVYN
jgi:hypothetical protein